MTNKKITLSVLAWIALAIILAGCPKPPVAPKEEPEAVVLKYQFPRGRVLKYRSKTNTRMKFTFPFITEPQMIRSETTVDYAERVIQEPLAGYAVVEQRITAYRLLLYQGDDLIYDSAQPEKFSPQPQFEKLLNLGNVVFKYEISQDGSIRRSEGLDTLGSSYLGPGGISSAFENSQPTLPQTAVRVGQTWENKKEIPITTAKGLKGSMIINDRAKLVDVKKDGNSRKALIELNRILNANLDMWDPQRKKFRPLVKGSGTSFFTILMDIDKGIIILTEGRMNITISSKVSDQPQMDEITIDLDGIINTTLVE